MMKRLPTLSIVALALAAPVAVQAQNYADLPPLTPMSEAEMRTLPPEYRTAPAGALQAGETVTTVNGIETSTRTRRIDAPRPLPAAPAAPQAGYAHGYTPAYAPPMRAGVQKPSA